MLPAPLGPIVSEENLHLCSILHKKCWSTGSLPRLGVKPILTSVTSSVQDFQSVNVISYKKSIPPLTSRQTYLQHGSDPLQQQASCCWECNRLSDTFEQG